MKKLFFIMLFAVTLFSCATIQKSPTNVSAPGKATVYMQGGETIAANHPMDWGASNGIVKLNDFGKLPKKSYNAKRSHFPLASNKNISAEYLFVGFSDSVFVYDRFYPSSLVLKNKYTGMLEVKIGKNLGLTDMLKIDGKAYNGYADVSVSMGHILEIILHPFEGQEKISGSYSFQVWMQNGMHHSSGRMSFSSNHYVRSAYTKKE